MKFTIYNLNSNNADEQRYKHEEHKHGGNRISLHKNELIRYKGSRKSGDYPSTENVDPQSCFNEESPNFSNKSRIEQETESDFGYSNRTKNLIKVAGARDNNSEDGELEGEESGYDSDDSNSRSNLGYHQDDTLNRSSNLNDRSLIDQTQNPFIKTKDPTNDPVFRKSQLESPSQMHARSVYKSDSEYEGEESEDSQDESLAQDSQRSGMGSSSRIEHSQYSSRKDRNSSRDSRSDHSRSNRGTYSFYDSNSNFWDDNATESVITRTRKGHGPDSYYETESPIESWEVQTPQDVAVQHRKTQAVHENHIELGESLRSPEDRSLILDSNPKMSRNGKLYRKITEESYRRSKMYESSHGENPQTVKKKQRSKKGHKKTNGSKAAKVKTSNIITEDRELESALSRKTRDIPQHTPEAADVISQPYELTSSSEYTDRRSTKFDSDDYRSLKRKYRQLKVNYHKLSLEKDSKDAQLDDCRYEIGDLNRRCIYEEQERLAIQDKLLHLERIQTRLSGNSINKIAAKELGDARTQIADLKHSYSELESENNVLKEK